MNSNRFFFTGGGDNSREKKDTFNPHLSSEDDLKVEQSIFVSLFQHYSHEINFIICQKTLLEKEQGKARKNFNSSMNRRKENNLKKKSDAKTEKQSLLRKRERVKSRFMKLHVISSVSIRIGLSLNVTVYASRRRRCLPGGRSTRGGRQPGDAAMSFPPRQEQRMSWKMLRLKETKMKRRTRLRNEVKRCRRSVWVPSEKRWTCPRKMSVWEETRREWGKERKRNCDQFKNWVE